MILLVPLTLIAAVLAALLLLVTSPTIFLGCMAVSFIILLGQSRICGCRRCISRVKGKLSRRQQQRKESTFPKARNQ